MPKATGLYNLYIINPGLAKEWHPSRNGDLNPRNVTPGSGKKVWWICADGHEWEAKVKSRMKGNDCPDCNKYLSTKRSSKIKKISRLGEKMNYPGAGPIQLDDALQSSDSQLSAATGFRKSRRYRRKSTVILEEPKSGAWSYAQSKDFSSEGMLLESEIAFKPGTRINIKFGSQSFNPPEKFTNPP